MFSVSDIGTNILVHVHLHPELNTYEKGIIWIAMII